MTAPRRKRPRSPNGSPRVSLHVKVHRASREALDKRAADEGLDRSELARRALAYALQKMPRGWPNT